MAKLYLSELSRKARKRVKKALRIANKWHDLESDYSFKQTEAGVIDFSVRDPITGIEGVGELHYSKRGYIKKALAVAVYDSGIPDFFYSIEYLGKKGFEKHTKAAYRRNDELERILARHGFSKQRVANWLDELPGANPYDPESTLVDFGQTYKFAFA